MADASRTLESSADFARGGDSPTPDHDADNASRKSRLEAEEKRLIQWAQANRKVGSRLPPEDSRGGEHQVYFEKRTRRYLKATLQNRQLGYGIALGSFIHGATPAEYLDRLSLQNRVFDDDIRLEHIVIRHGKPIIVTSQPAIEGIAATPTVLDDLMDSKGYQKLADGAYYDETAGLLIFDLFPRNAIQTMDGGVYPIDPVIQRITADFGQFLRDHPNTINMR